MWVQGGVSGIITPFRSYDALSGRWRSHDPIFQPWESTYLGMGGNPAMMVDPWGLLSNPLMPSGKPLPTVAFLGNTPPKMPNVLDGIRKAQGTPPPSSYAMAGSERFVPDWVKKQGKSWTDGFVDAFTAEANEALDGIKNAPEAIQEAVSAFLKDPGGLIGDLVKAGLGDFGELLDLIELRSNPKHPYDAGQRNGKLAFRALGFLGGAGFAGLAARAPKLFKLLTGRRKPRAASNVVASRGLSQIDEFVDLTKHRRDHILNRHRAGAGKPGKTEFPRDWSDERILHQVSDVATDPNAVRGVGKHNIPYAIATRDGIEIRVDFYAHDHPRFAGQISTAYPTNVPANP